VPHSGKNSPRKSTQAEREAFFQVLERVGNIRQAARDLGLNANTCYGWAGKAGIRGTGEPGTGPHPGRAEYDRLRGEGVPRQAAAQRVGVNIRTARDWDRGVRKSGTSRTYPDGRRVDYKRGVTEIVAQLRLEKVLDPRFLSLQDREKIQDMRAAGSSVRAIAAALGRAPSTISRELRRNSDGSGVYRPYAAHRAAAGRRPRPKDRKILTSPRLLTYVQDKLALRWSPEQICHALIEEFPDDAEMRVCTETVYQTLYLQARGGLRREIAAALRTGRARRKPHTTGQTRTQRFVDEMVMISERPPEVEDRAVPGHWEGDLIIGANSQSAIATLVERTTRYVMLVHLPGDHTAETVREGLVATMATLPEHLRGSLTWDQGAEMASHRSFTIATNMPVYFCDPASPWQRGSNENTNGLLRQYFPKGTDLSAYGPEDLEHVAQQLNGRPRKTLGWKTPAERLRDLLLTA
jgi:transposase, IS30 family